MKSKHHWFEPGFPMDVRKFIERNPCPYDTGFYCHEDSRRWALFLLENGVKGVSLKSGLFFENDREEGVGHSWVEVGGKIFDPTASQFRGKKYSGLYEELESYDGNEIRKSRIT